MQPELNGKLWQQSSVGQSFFVSGWTVPDRRLPDAETTTVGGEVERPIIETSRRLVQQLSRGVVLPDVTISGLRKWEGRVVTVEDDLITAEMTPLDDVGPTVYADFDVELMDEDGFAPVASGDVVYLTVRTVRDRGGRKTTTTTWRRRRMGVWTQDELEGVAEGGREDFEAFRQLSE